MAKRKTQWIDTILTTPSAIPGAVDPGTVQDNVILSETELENVPNSTLIRVVGSITVARTAGSPVLSFALWLSPNYEGIALPGDWRNDEFQRGSILWTHLFFASGSVEGLERVRLDIRSKRRMT